LRLDEFRVLEEASVAFGATEAATDEADFHQLPSFAYLTGYDRPDAAFVMVVRTGRVAYQMLFEPPTDPRLALYNGFPPDSGDLARRTGLGLRHLEALRPMLDTLIGRGPLFVVSDVHSRDYLRSDTLTRGRRFVQHFWGAHPRLEVRSADPLLDSLRVVKSPAEVALLRRVVAISADGHQAAMRRVAPGVNERDILALTDYTFRTAGGAGASFRAIVGSGPNSTSYYYRANDRVMQAGEVVVIDAGALYQGYVGDVTRTLPVNGRFTPDQAAVYRIVRAAQAAAEAVARPGAPVAAGDSAIRAVPDRAVPAERGVYDQARGVHQHHAARHAPRYAQEPAVHRQGPPGGALQPPRRADRGRLPRHRDRSGTVVARAARNPGNRGGDAAPLTRRSA
jgi:Xaa-Pro aminopeptidase